MGGRAPRSRWEPEDRDPSLGAADDARDGGRLNDVSDPRGGAYDEDEDAYDDEDLDEDDDVYDEDEDEDAYDDEDGDDLDDDEDDQDLDDDEEDDLEDEPGPANAPAARRLVPVFLIGALAGMLVIALAWGAAAFLTRDDGTGPGAAAVGTRPGSGAGQPGPSGSPVSTAAGNPTGQDTGQDTGQGTGQDTGQAPASSGADLLTRCQQADASLATPLRAAAAALSQWEVHVGAMNKLVVGAITVKQAMSFWAQTRVGASRHLAAFHAASHRLRTQGVDCPPAPRLPRSEPALRSCARLVDADLQAMAAARTATRTWAGHVRDMEMLRMGHLSPAAASAMWLSSWQRGVDQLNAYKSALRVRQRAGHC